MESIPGLIRSLKIRAQLFSARLTKETPRRRRTVTSSLNEIPVVKHITLEGVWAFTLRRYDMKISNECKPFLRDRMEGAWLWTLDRYFIDDVNGFFLHLGYLLHEKAL